MLACAWVALAMVPPAIASDDRAEVAKLAAQAKTLSKEMGALAASGRIPQDREAIEQLRRIVDQLDAINKRLEVLEDRLNRADEFINAQRETLPGLLRDVADLRRTAWGSYMQVQFRALDQPGSTANEAFQIRRARFTQVQAIDTRTSMRLSVDFATSSNQLSAELKDALISYTITPGGKGRTGTQWVTGQQNMPLGYEIARSSGSRELPERSRYNTTYFSGERGLGTLLRHGIGENMVAYAGVFNALTVGDAEQRGLAQGSGSRLGAVGGFRFETPNAEYGISGFAGSRPTFPGESSSSPSVDRSFLYLDGTYIGLFDPRLTLRAEYMRGKDRVPNSSSPGPNRIARDTEGYHLMAVWRFNARNSFAVRYEVFDPASGVGDDKFNAVGLCYLYNIRPNMRLMFASEFFDDQALESRYGRAKYNISTVRLQVRF